MMSANNGLGIFLPLLIVIISCDRPGRQESELLGQKKTYSNNISYINYESDTIYYKLPLDIKDAGYEIDRKGNITILVTKKIATCDKEFVGKENIRNALNYHRDVCERSASHNWLYEVYTVSIKKLKSNHYETIWIWKNPMKLEDYGFGKSDFHFYLETNDCLIDGKTQSRLNLNFKNIDFDTGYILYTLSYINESNGWKFVSKERINTTGKDDYLNVYYRETYTEDVVSAKFELTNDFIMKYNK